MLTFQQLKVAERAVLWPSPGEPRNLREAHDRFFAAAMTDLSHWIDCLQENNTTVHAACSTYTQCAKTVVPAPAGRIKRVYTIANSGWCDRVYYRSASFGEIEHWSRESMPQWTAPVSTSLPELQEGFAYPDSSNDGHCGRALTGLWAIYRGQLHVAPWLESNESLVVEFDGPKEEWGEDDLIDPQVWTIDVREAIRAYVDWQHEAHFGCDRQVKLDKRQDYFDKRAVLMYRCQQRTEEQHEDIMDVGEPRRYQTKAETDAAAVPDPQDLESVFAVISDFGMPSGGAGDVADLVKSWNPAFIMSAGDNIYSPVDNYDDAVGQFYGDYITSSLNTNRFWPARGNHDIQDPVNGIADFEAYFTLPGNGRYFELVRGTVHIFVLHTALASLGSTPPEPDGLSASSAQAMWLKARMSLSTAPWKIVIAHDAPYSLGDDFPGHTILRWPFRLWGADVVISGDDHLYTRYLVDSLPYLVVGLGGATKDTPHALGENEDYVQEEFHDDWGALKVTADCSTLKMDFITRAGVLVDTLELEKD